MEQQINETTKIKRQWKLPLVSGFIGGIAGYTLMGYVAPLASPQTTSTFPTTQSTPIQQTNTKLEEPSITNAINKAHQAIVSVTNYQNGGIFSRSSDSLQEAGVGSGVIYKIDTATNSAYIVTNNHVIDNAEEIEITLSHGYKAKAEVIGTDALTDLAVLKMSNQEVKASATFANSENVTVGQTVLAIGSPLGSELSTTVTKGIVSAVKRAIPTDTNNDNIEDWASETIQTDAAINPGNSGGALVDLNGDVIGINSMKIANTAVEGIGFAIPSNDVVTIITALEKDGKITRPTLGVSLVDLAEVNSEDKTQILNLPETVSEGVVLNRIVPNGTSDKAQLQRYDVVVSWNGQKITDSVSLRRQLYKHAIGDNITLEIYRDGKLETITLTLQ